MNAAAVAVVAVAADEDYDGDESDDDAMVDRLSSVVGIVVRKKAWTSYAVGVDTCVVVAVDDVVGRFVSDGVDVE